MTTREYSDTPGVLSTPKRPFGHRCTVWLWDYSATGYVNLTPDIVRLDSNAADGIAEPDDYFYVGFDRRFDAILLWLDTTGTYTGITWQISTSEPDTWTDVYPVQPREYLFGSVRDYVQFDHMDEDFENWSPVAFSSTAPHGAAPPDTRSRYWMRAKATTATATVVLNTVTVRPYAFASTPKNIQEQLQISEAFTQDTTPSLHTVERFIRGAEDLIYYQTGHYFRPEFVEDELLNFRAYGMATRRRPILDILELAVYTGGYWEPKGEGKDRDFHYSPKTGMIYSSTIFLDTVPPTLRRGYSLRREQGSYKQGIRIRYVHGHDGLRDPFAVQVGRIVTKRAAIDILSNYDFATLIPQNLDRLTLQQKVDLWKEEVEDFLGTYTKIFLE